MAKKKKETCPYCGKSFAYLSRHKCRIKEKVEGVEDDKSESERRSERIEEKKKTVKRSLKKDEKEILDTINEKLDIYFEDLLSDTGTNRTHLEEILDVLVLKNKIKIRRELINAAWTKRIFSIINYEDQVKISDANIDENKKDFIWDMFSRQPCFICPFTEKCNETNMEFFNPNHCPWLTQWVEISILKGTYDVDFDEIQEKLQNY